ncbi:DUF6318 family protein [Arthrobacter pityocampae]|uniref:DUF6318 family protein n=1 Tax=Arthrobacter pityocampae TaxID=547334 RepID=UPI0011B074C7|nr:DUF6318 family protein [Arthrobacter pityocampae]
MFPVRAEGHRRAVPILAGAAVALLLLTGCRNDADAAPIPTSEPPSSQAPATSEPTTTPSVAPEPSPASSAGPATNIPVPVKPALADENSPEGLEAFTAYWLELFSYGYETNDWAPFEAVTDPGCRTCENLKAEVQKHYESGGWIDGGGISLNSTNTEFVENTTGSINSFIDITQNEILYFDSSGIEVKGSKKTEPVLGVSIAYWEVDHWVMLDFGSPEGS